MDVFSDPGWEDAHRVNIDWGDGITDTVLKAAGEQEAEFSHIYKSPASYNLVVIITDNGSLADSQTLAIVAAPPRRFWLSASFKQ